MIDAHRRPILDLFDDVGHVLVRRFYGKFRVRLLWDD